MSSDSASGHEKCKAMPASAGGRERSVELKVRELAAEVCNHSVFAALTSMQAVRVFMEHHVWAVWDFMSILKSIQAEVAPVAVPWKPPLDAEAARLINEIVVSEEGDLGPDGLPISHFEAYVQAMRAAGANTAPIEHFLAALHAGAPLTSALHSSAAPPAAKSFVETTFRIIQEPLHSRIAAFTLGREDVIPQMFRSALLGLKPSSEDPVPANLSVFLWYLDRHITVDADEHGPAADKLFQRICLQDERRRTESFAAACSVLEQRRALWEAVLSALHR
jgi:hypothetical protein